MQFKLKAPCKDCPFRSDRDHPFFGRSESGYDRASSLSQGFITGHTFPCHKTAQWREDEDGDTQQVQTEKTQACAGMVIMGTNSDEGAQGVRIAERIGMLDLDQMDWLSPVYEDYQAFIDDHDPYL